MQKKPLTPQQALSRLGALCSRSEYAESECRAKLAGWGISPHDADSIMQSLIANHFVDNRRYAHAFCNDKFRFSGWGKIKIAYTLRQKGIADTFIADALADIPDEEYRDTLQRLLKSKATSLRGKDFMHAKASMMRFAASRGFDAALASDIASQILKSNDDDYDTDDALHFNY